MSIIHIDFNKYCVVEKTREAIESQEALEVQEIQEIRGIQGIQEAEGIQGEEPMGLFDGNWGESYLKDGECNFQSNPNVFGLEGFALLGRNPKCGCPLAIDLSASLEARVEFEQRGLLLEFLPPELASSVWEASQWPCHHSKLVLD
jgi:hypothetical protein